MTPAQIVPQILVYEVGLPYIMCMVALLSKLLWSEKGAVRKGAKLYQNEQFSQKLIRSSKPNAKYQNPSSSCSLDILYTNSQC